MKKTSKISLALVVMMILMMALAVIPASAKNMTGGEKLYLVPNSNWNQSNARFAIYVFGNGDAWVSMEKVAGEDNLYVAEVPAGNWTNVIFCRMNPSTTANNWNNKWNQTSDLTYDGTKNCYTVKTGTWDNGDGTWSTYTPADCQHAPETDKVVSNTATCTQNGEITRTCASCKENYTKTSAYLNHDFVDGDCSRCDVVLNNVYYENAEGWTSVNYYTWNDTNDYKYSTWPGSAMTQDGDVWVASVPSDCTMIIFNNGTDQTDDLALPTDGNNYYASGEWTIYIPGCQHADTEEKSEQSATCGASGTAAGTYCNVCHQFIEGGETIQPTGDHEYNETTGKCDCGAVDLNNTITIYFENNWLWSDVKCYYWYADGTYAEAWPGVNMTKVSTRVGNNATYDYYSIEVPLGIDGLQFNGTNDNSVLDQSPDITEGWHDGICYYMLWEDGNKVGSFDYVDYYSYRGESVRYELNGEARPDTAVDIRVGYVLDEAVTAWGWNYKLGSKDAETKDGEYINDDGISSIVFAGVEYSSFQSTIQVQLWVKVTLDGVEYTYYDVVREVVTLNTLDKVTGTSNEAAVAYAEAVIAAYEAAGYTLPEAILNDEEN